MNYLDKFMNSLTNHLQFDVSDRSFKNEPKLNGSMVHFGSFEKKLEEFYNDDKNKFVCVTLCHCKKLFLLSSRNMRLFMGLLNKMKKMDQVKPIIILLENEAAIDERFHDLIKDASQSICYYPFKLSDSDTDDRLTKGASILLKLILLEGIKRGVVDKHQLNPGDADVVGNLLNPTPRPTE
jgi:hypothetical protein